MSMWVVRFYDHIIRTNYVESCYDARDTGHALRLALLDQSIRDQCSRRFRYISSLEEGVRRRCFEIIQVPKLD